jgi:DNA-binding response OmpR family regulator
LIVEDDLEIREKLSKLLKDEGYRVSSAADGREGVQKAKDGEYHVILTDLVMPDMDGMEVMKEIKKIKPSCQVIIITAFATIDSAVEAVKKGAYDYIAKPFKINEVQVAIKRALEEARFPKEEKITPPADISLLYSDAVIKVLANPVRKEIIRFLRDKEGVRFKDIKKGMDINYSSKLAFHIRELKSAGLIKQDRLKKYRLSEVGEQVLKALKQ